MMDNLDLWPEIKILPALPDNQVNLYRIDLTEALEIGFNPLNLYLTPAEQQRANRYRFEKDKINFGVGRFASKLLIGNHINTEFQNINFQLSEYGKPFLENPYNSLNFNLSHSGKYLLIGLGFNCDIGVDVERYNYTVDHIDLSKTAFSISEQKELIQLSQDQHIPGFYRCWSLKESFIKAVGLGLQIPLDEFSMRIVGIDRKNRLINTNWKPQLLHKLTSHTITFDSEYAAAYTCNSEINQVKSFDITHLITNQLN